METDPLSLRPDAAAEFAAHRAAYLAQLVAPMDDMWAAFADMARPYALLVGDAVAGSCAVDGEGQLLRFFVVPDFAARAAELLRLVLRELEVSHLMVCSSDPGFLDLALDLSPSVVAHSVLFEHVSEPEVPGLESLTTAEPGDLERIVAFQVEQTGMPRAFLEPYGQERLERREFLLFEEDGQLLTVAELRVDRQQPGVAHLGLIVRAEERGRGLGSRVLASLVAKSQALGLAPHCSTEVTNPAARRAIERAGFHASHRVLRVDVPR